jgi:hypothetical protein
MLGDRPEAQAGADNLKHRKGAPYAARRVMSRRFPPPWSIEVEAYLEIRRLRGRKAAIRRLLLTQTPDRILRILG